MAETIIGISVVAFIIGWAFGFGVCAVLDANKGKGGKR